MNELRVLGAPEPDPPPEAVTAIYPDWESVYQDNVVGIYQLAFRKVGNAPDAEDRWRGTDLEEFPSQGRRPVAAPATQRPQPRGIDRVPKAPSRLLRIGRWLVDERRRVRHGFQPRLWNRLS